MAQPAETKVSFSSKAGKRLVGTLRDVGLEAVVLCHGLGSHKDGFHLPALAAALAERGLSSLRFDFSGNGESEGHFAYGNHHEEADEIAAAVAFLEGRCKYVHGLLGHSKGVTAVLLFCASGKRVSRVVNASGRWDHRQGTLQRFGPDTLARIEREGGVELTWTLPERGRTTWWLSKEDLAERLGMDMAAVISRIADKVDVLTVHGSADETIPLADGRTYAQHLPGHLMQVVEGADHSYSQHGARFVQLAADFLAGGSAAAVPEEDDD